MGVAPCEPVFSCKAEDHLVIIQERNDRRGQVIDGSDPVGYRRPSQASSSRGSHEPMADLERKVPSDEGFEATHAELIDNSNGRRMQLLIR